VHLSYPNFSGTLATGGGLVFLALLDGTVAAFDDTTLDELWKIILTLHGQKSRVPLGSCSAVPLSKAREAAAAVMGDVTKAKNPAAERKEAAAAERASCARNRLTLPVLIDDWNRLHLAGQRTSYAVDAVRAPACAFNSCTPMEEWTDLPNGKRPASTSGRLARLPIEKSVSKGVHVQLSPSLRPLQQILGHEDVANGNFAVHVG
jgi:outer membrane protein assembly factor BamB